jgi:hypothetical protein
MRPTSCGRMQTSWWLTNPPGCYACQMVTTGRFRTCARCWSQIGGSCGSFTAWIKKRAACSSWRATLLLTRDLSAQFSEHRVSKRYHTLITGDLDWESKEVRLPLRSQVGRRKRTIVDPKSGKPAVTIFRQLENFGETALVEACPLTGRTHQIRAHLYAIHCSILADPLYGPTRDATSPRLERMALHALEISLYHPKNQESMVFTAPYPDDFAAALRELRRAAG